MREVAYCRGRGQTGQSPGCCDRRWPGDIRNGRSSCRVGDAERNPGRPEGGHAPMSMPVGRGAASGEQPRRHIDSPRSEEHTSELQSLMRISYAVFCLKKKKKRTEERDERH